VDIFVPWLESRGFRVEISHSLDAYLDTAKLKSLDLIVQVWTQGAITPAQKKGLLEAVMSGVGLAGWHGGPRHRVAGTPVRGTAAPGSIFL